MSKRIFIGALLFSAFLFAYGDENDSLKNLLTQDSFSSKTEQVETLILLSKGQFYTSQDEAISNGEKALDIALETNDKLLVSKAAKNIGILYYRQSEFANALKYLNLALKYNIEANNVDELAASYNNLGLIYRRLGNYNLALDNHLKQLKINEETGNLRGLANSNLNIGNIYYSMRENDKSLEYYLKSLQINEEIQDTNRVATVLINLALVSMELEDYDQAVGYFNRALPIKMKYDDKTNLGKIYTNLGVVYNSQKKYPLAILYFLKSLDVSSDINHRYNMCVSMINLGDAYLNEGDMDKSLDFLNRALAVAREMDSQELIRDTYGVLSKWHEAKNNFESALEYYKSMTELKDSLFTTEKSNQLKNLQVVYEVEKIEKDNLEKDISIEKLKTSQFYLLLIIVVALSLVFVAYYRYRTKKRHNHELEIKIAEALQKEKEQQQIIVHKSSLTSLGELASGIAHEIKQPLQNISLVNEGLQIELSEEQIDPDFITSSTKDIAEGIKRIKFIINEISNFSRGQQQEIMEWFNINTRIENAFSLARTKFSNRRIDVRFKLDKTIPEFQGNPYKFEQVVVNFFNNAKDAIEEKAEKIGEDFAKKMIVRSYIKDHFIHVEVEDNGAGIPESNQTKIFLPFFTTKELGKGTGLGLSISLGIAKEMGGFVEMESDLGKGTLMRLKLPVIKA